MTTYDPSFDIDYQKCGSWDNPFDPTINGSSVTFATSDGTCASGRVVSKQAYKNITKITATVDLSKMSQNYVNASYYLISNPTNPTVQPIGDDYCDAGGNRDDQNARELDLMETNGNKITQTTLHLGDGGSAAPQRFEFSFTEKANNSCFNYASMLTSPASDNGLHSLVDSIDMSKPFESATTFTYGDNPTMVMQFTQDGKTVTVYDSNNGDGAYGSGSVKMSDLTNTMADGCWIILSQWQGYSPKGPSNGVWWNDSCGWGQECGTDSHWGISNIVVTAE